MHCNKTKKYSAGWLGGCKSHFKDYLPQFKTWFFTTVNCRIQSTELKAGNELMKYLNVLGVHYDSTMVGAYRGLVMLQETYNLDIMEMAKGRVSYKGRVFQVKIDFLILEKNYARIIEHVDIHHK